jgi:hypothetical protein
MDDGYRNKGLIYESSINERDYIYSSACPDIHVKPSVIIFIPGGSKKLDSKISHFSKDNSNRVIKLLVESKLIKINTKSILIKELLTEFKYDKIDESIYNFDNIANILK